MFYRYKEIVYELVENPFTSKMMLDASCGCVDFEEVTDKVEPATREEFEKQEMKLYEGTTWS